MGMEKSLYPASSHQALIYLKAFIVLVLCLSFFRFNNLSFFILSLLLTWCCFSRPLIIFTAFFQALSNYSTLVCDAVVWTLVHPRSSGWSESLLWVLPSGLAASLSILWCHAATKRTDVIISWFINTPSNFAKHTLLLTILIIYTLVFNTCWVSSFLLNSTQSFLIILSICEDHFEF